MKNTNQPTKRQLQQANKAAKFLLDEKMTLEDALNFFHTIDLVFYPWMRIEQIQYKRLGGTYDGNESDDLHNQAGNFAWEQIEQAYKQEKKSRRTK